MSPTRTPMSPYRPVTNKTTTIDQLASELENEAIMLPTVERLTGPFSYSSTSSSPYGSLSSSNTTIDQLDSELERAARMMHAAATATAQLPTSLSAYFYSSSSPSSPYGSSSPSTNETITDDPLALSIERAQMMMNAIGTTQQPTSPSSYSSSPSSSPYGSSSPSRNETITDDLLDAQIKRANMIMNAIGTTQQPTSPSSYSFSSYSSPHESSPSSTTTCTTTTPPRNKPSRLSSYGLIRDPEKEPLLLPFPVTYGGPRHPEEHEVRESAMSWCCWFLVVFLLGLMSYASVLVWAPGLPFPQGHIMGN
ncbi:Uu.00g003820.m01.CDS01 [Anthostomella pinea]|uniref:Uu.00g003820.m01.CDS01 n=1 Tax=Anthostomella pinea TaxID=933095 RepID=A0AAI8VKJ6_9PEZI|nr:Uu.00g003820.m01.CDS01 [Anthostomella pinea]